MSSCNTASGEVHHMGRDSVIRASEIEGLRVSELVKQVVSDRKMRVLLDSGEVVEVTDASIVAAVRRALGR